LKRKASNSSNKYANVCFFLPTPGSKEFWINQPVKVMNVACPALVQLAGPKPAIRLNASLVTEQEKRPRPGDLQWRCTGDSIRICSKITFLRLGCPRARSILTTRTADLVLCLMNGLESMLTYAPPVWPHPEPSCRSKHSMQKCFPFLSALCPSALRYSLSVESCRACLTLPVTVLS
jgi:hypothetical protein